MTDFIQVETLPGQLIITREVRLLPFAQNLTLHLPFLNIALVWNRPVSVLVTSANGLEQVLPVRDPTRQIVWTLYGITVALIAVTGLYNFVKRGKNEQGKRIGTGRD
jgi:hypothetical protein